MVWAGAWLVVLGLGCDGGKPQEHRCDCTFFTDFDDPSSTEVRVCVARAADAVEAAKGCAQSGSPAPVQACTCAPSKGAACKVGACRVADHKPATR